MDPISDMLSMIRNAQAVYKPEVFVPFSKMNYEIAKILEKEGFVGSIRRIGKGVRRKIKIGLKYISVSEDRTHLKGQPAIAGLKRISKPGQRLYGTAKSIRPVRGGFGIAIISTSQGLMTDKEARKKRLGGEIICQVW